MLNKKMWREIRQNKIQFLSIFIMIFLGAFIYSGVGGEWRGIQKTSEEYLNETNAADFWLSSKGFADNDLTLLDSLKEVNQVEGKMVIPAVTSGKNDSQLELNFTTRNKISKVKLMKGSAFDINTKGIWLDEAYAKANRLKVGTDFKLFIEKEELILPIKGFILNPDYIYFSNGIDFIPNHATSGYAYIPYFCLPKLYQGSYNQILVDTNTSLSVHDFEKKLQKDNSVKFSTLQPQSEKKSYQTFNEEIEQHKTMGSIFPIVFLLIAMLTVSTTLTRLISQQRTLIGTLKAIGFKKGKILRHYVSYSFVLSTIAAVLGGVIGPLTLPQLFYPSMSNSYSLPEWRFTFHYSFILLPIILALCCTLISYCVARNFVNEPPSSGMKPLVKKQINLGWLQKTKFWRSLGFSNHWNIRDILSNKIRSLMGIVGVAGCTGLLLCALGMKASINSLIDWQFHQNNNYQTQINLQSLPISESEKIAGKFNGELTQAGMIEIKSKEVSKTASIKVIEADSKMTQLNSRKAKKVDIPSNGVGISYKLADLLKVKAGDKIKWHLSGKDEWITSEIKALFYLPTDQGIVLSRDYFEKCNETFSPNIIFTKEKGINKQTGMSSVWVKSEMESGVAESLDAINLMVAILIIAAVIMALVVLYCLGILMYTEKYHELATLKVLGFRSTRLRKLLLGQTCYLGVAAIPLGYAFGYFILQAVLSDMGDDFDFMLTLPISGLLICSIGALLLSLIITWVFSSRVKSVNLVEALKSGE